MANSDKGGNARQRRKSERTGDDIPTPPKSPENSPWPAKKNNDMPSKFFTTNDLLLVVVFPIVGVVLAFVGLVEMFPIYVNLAVYVAALVAIETGVWRWERAVKWGIRYRLAILSIVALLYGGLLATPVVKQYRRENDMVLMFKDDELFTWWNKWVIQQEFIKMRQYFIDLDIPVPKQIPPINVSEGASTMGYRKPAYRGNLGIGKYLLINRNREGIASTYSDYVIAELVLPVGPSTANEQAVTDFRLFLTFSGYFISSRWDHNNQLGDWSRQLWQVRGRLGKEFADRLAAYTLLSFVDSPNEEQDKRFSVYFCNHLRIGYSILDDKGKKWQDILHSMSAEYSKSCPAN